MKLFILGATGGTGSELVGQALARGHEVTAFVRSPEKITHADDRLRILTGDPHETVQLVPALAGHDAVVSALGSRSLGHTTLLTDCARSALAAMDAARVRRLLVVSTALLFPDAGFVAAVLRRFIFFNVVRDSRAMETVVTAADVDWTIARPPRLTHGPHTGRYRFEKDHLPSCGRSISRADLAHFLLDAITNDKLLQGTVGISG
jgi:putative NADH-flavin reductase